MFGVCTELLPPSVRSAASLCSSPDIRKLTTAPRAVNTGKTTASIPKKAAMSPLRKPFVQMYFGDSVASDAAPSRSSSNSVPAVEPPLDLFILTCDRPPTQPLKIVDQIVDAAPNNVASNPTTFARSEGPQFCNCRRNPRTSSISPSNSDEISEGNYHSMQGQWSRGNG